MTSTDANFEARLIEALQPVRGFALAQGIHHLFASGLFAALAAASGGRRVDDLAGELGLDPEPARGFLRYLANEDLVALAGDAVTLTPRGRGMAEFRPWYELLVGGYAQTFQQVTDVLRGAGHANRDGAMVGVGSCGISAYDALPLVRGLLVDLPGTPSRIVDLGCGDGQFLADLIGDHPGVAAVGVDPYAPAASPDPRLTFVRGSATSYVRDLPAPGEPAGTGRPLFLAAFLLQEILEQEGRSAVVELVGGVLRQGAHLAVVEVDHRPADPAVMRHGLGLAYYNPYYLLHVLTEQRLETVPFWLELFADAGAEVVARQQVDPRVDSTGLEFGCLLRPAGSGPA